MSQYRVRLHMDDSGVPVIDTGVTVEGTLISYSDLVCDVMVAHRMMFVTSAHVFLLDGPDIGVVVSLLWDMCPHLNTLVLSRIQAS